MTTLYYYFFNKFLPGSVFNEKLRLLSKEQNDRIGKFKRQEDAHASLVGKLLLLRGFKEFEVPATLKDLKFSFHGKPYIDNSSISFNISHSGNHVVCILSNDTTSIGIDVEEIKPVNIIDFKNIWNENEWREIQKNDLRVFYQYWTRKEAVIKAEGRGLSIPLNSIEIQKTRAVLENQTYYLKEISLQSNVIINIASLNRVDHMKAIGIETI